MRSKILGMFIAFFGLFFSVQAQHGHHNDGQFNRRERIRDGWQSGELTRAEIKQLKKEKRFYHKTKQRMLADGKLDRKEKRRLREMRANGNKQLWCDKHDSQRRRHR